jgi:hypothetical protein
MKHSEIIAFINKVSPNNDYIFVKGNISGPYVNCKVRNACELLELHNKFPECRPCQKRYGYGLIMNASTIKRHVCSEN